MTDFGQCGRARVLQWILTNVNKVKIPSTNNSVSFYQLNRADSRKRAHLHNWCVCNKASFCVMNKLCCRSWSNTCNLTKKWKSSSFVCMCVIWNSILFSLKMSDVYCGTNSRDPQNDVRVWFRNVGAIVNFEHWAIFIAPFIQLSPRRYLGFLHAIH
jgi:hypothetical protein